MRREGAECRAKRSAGSEHSGPVVHAPMTAAPTAKAASTPTGFLLGVSRCTFFRRRTTWPGSRLAADSIAIPIESVRVRPDDLEVAV